jgi:hypothetical protein
MEQRINIKFCLKTGNTASEMLALVTLPYDEYAIKKSSVFERYRRFKEGREDVQDDPRSGQPKRKGQMQMWREYKPWYTQIED